MTKELTHQPAGELLGPESQFAIDRSTLRREWEAIVVSANTIKIVDQDSALFAAAHGRLLQRSSKNLDEFYKPIKQKIDALKKTILEAEKADRALVEDAKTRLSEIVQDWNTDKDVLDIVEEIDEDGMPVPSIVQSKEKITGVVERTTYKAVVYDIHSLVLAVADQKVSSEAILPNQSYLNDLASTYREGLNVPGVSVKAETKTHFRS